MKKDGPVKPAEQQDQDYALPPQLTIQRRLRRPLRERRGLCEMAHWVRVREMRLAYANASRDAIELRIQCTNDEKCKREANAAGGKMKARAALAAVILFGFAAAG